MRHLILFFLLLSVAGLAAQIYPFSDDENVAFAGIYPLEHEESVVGYCVVGREILPPRGEYLKGRGRYVDNGPARQLSFVVQLLDTELAVLGQSDFAASENTTVQSVAYNGGLLALELTDPEEKKKYVMTFDGSGQKVKQFVLPWIHTDTKDQQRLLQAEGYKTLFSAADGFIYVANGNPGSALAPSKTMYKVTFLPNDPEQKPWHYSSEKKIAGLNRVKPIAEGQDLIVFSISSKKGYFNKRGASSVIGLNASDGKLRFRHERDDERYPVSVYDGRIIDDRLYVVGFDVGESGLILTDPPLAINLLVYDLDGQQVDHRRNYLDEALEGGIDFVSRGRGKDNDRLFIHDFNIDRDGQIFMAGELYTVTSKGVFPNKAVSALFDSTLQVKVMDSFEKEEGAFYLANSRLTQESKVAFYAKQQGAFGYSSLKTSGSVTYSTYIVLNNPRSASSPLKVYFHVLNEDKLVSDNIQFPSVQRYPKVLPAKEGYVLVGELNTEKKEYGIRIERLALNSKR